MLLRTLDASSLPKPPEAVPTNQDLKEKSTMKVPSSEIGTRLSGGQDSFHPCSYPYDGSSPFVVMTSQRS